MDAETKEFETRIKVRFQHTDPAGLVFYPRYLEMINQVVEDWFSDELGMSFRDLHSTERRGVPAVHVGVDFTRPSRLGDLLRFRLCVKSIGRTSISINIVADCDAEERVTAEVVLVYVDIDRFGTEKIPEDVRNRLRLFLCTK